MTDLVPAVVFHGIDAMPGDCRLEVLFDFASADDMARGTETLAAACTAFAMAGRFGAYAMAGNTRHVAWMDASAMVRAGERQAAVLLTASNTDPKAFQFLRNMLVALGDEDVRLERILVTAKGSMGAQAARLPPVDDLNESAAYPAAAVASSDFDLVWSDSQFSKVRRLIVDFRSPPPADLHAKLWPVVEAWFQLLERGAFCAPFGTPFETQSQRGTLSLYDETSYEISISRYVGSEAGFRVLANMLGAFSRQGLAIASVEID